MDIDLRLPYGSAPLPVASTSLRRFDALQVVQPPVPPPAQPLETLIEAALDHPVGTGRLETLVRPGERVALLVSDASREEPRTAMLSALLARLPSDIDITLGVACGTHGPCDLARLGIADDIWKRAARVINHDAHDDTDLISIGTTPRGTPVRVHRCLTEVDWIVPTGRIKPHYFAGFGAGCKAIFPGLGGNREIRINHQFKNQPGARAGCIDGNPCREDLEDAVSLLSAGMFLLNVVLDDAGGAQAAVAGDLRAAFRAGAAQCAPLHR